MGSIRKVSCPCGFKSSAKIGGGMRDFREYSTFPFYCEKCGLVDVNITKDELSCPKCNSTEVKQYGIPPISEPPITKLGSIAWGNYEAELKDHLCPSCGKNTMEFLSAGEIMFD
jgi:ribosomal protein S27AE